MVAHDVLTYLCAESVGFSVRPVRITPYTYSEMDRSPYNREYSIEMREGKAPAVTAEDPEYDENEYYTPFVLYEKPQAGKVSAIQVLALYSGEPDWGMDTGISLSPVQSLMGGSQGYRHLKYGLFFLRAGKALERALHFDRLSRAAFDRGDQYWGIRFAARAIHYMEDLLTPFHTKPFPELLLLRKLLDLRGLYFLTYNYHMNFERFTGYGLWHGNRDFIEPVRDAKVSALSHLHSDLQKAWRSMRNLFYLLFRECGALWREGMSEGPVKLKEEEVARINPSGRLHCGIRKWLGCAASVVKGYIAHSLIPRMQQPP
jgi:hypothetical protein